MKQRGRVLQLVMSVAVAGRRRIGYPHRERLEAAVSVGTSLHFNEAASLASAPYTDSAFWEGSHHVPFTKSNDHLRRRERPTDWRISSCVWPFTVVPGRNQPHLAGAAPDR